MTSAANPDLQNIVYPRFTTFITASWQLFERDLARGSTTLPTARTIREDFERECREHPQREIPFSALSAYTAQLEEIVNPYFQYDHLPKTPGKPTQVEEDLINRGLGTAIMFLQFLAYRTGANPRRMERAALQLSKTQLEQLEWTRSKVDPLSYSPIFDDQGNLLEELLAQAGFRNALGCPASAKPPAQVQDYFREHPISAPNVTLAFTQLYTRGIHEAVVPFIRSLTPEEKRGVLKLDLLIFGKKQKL